ncbi:MAG TPA: sugar ABC transporter substrate-binding protein, partial [Metabacillus sp.]|nr:sugar ABC transporter substrate-binding protein [Metabacillus sp.]
KLKEVPDVLIVSPIAPDEVTPILNKFVEKGIPTLLIDTDDPWKNKTSYIGTDNLELGRRAGQLLASQLQPGDKVVLLGGDVGDDGVTLISERIQGAKNSLKEAGIDVVTKSLSISYDEERLVKKGMEEVLQKHPDLKGVMAVTDIVALHAQEVLKKHGLSIPITGADGITEMLELIEDGTLSGSVSQNPYDMGYLSVEAAAKAIKGEKVEKNIDSGVDIIVKGNAERRLNFLREALN